MRIKYIGKERKKKIEFNIYCTLEFDKGKWKKVPEDVFKQARLLFPKLFEFDEENGAELKENENISTNNKVKKKKRQNKGTRGRNKNDV